MQTVGAFQGFSWAVSAMPGGALPTNCIIVARVQVPYHGATALRFGASLCLNADNGSGLPTDQDRYVETMDTLGDKDFLYARAYKTVSGTTTEVNVAGTQKLAPLQGLASLEYIVIRKSGTDFVSCVMDNVGRRYMHNIYHSITATLGHVSLLFNGPGASSNMGAIFGLDFVRIYDSFVGHPFAW
jgi:hypothetical protein